MKYILIILLAFTINHANAQKINGDTLSINDTSLHYIKINNQVFAIQRSVSLVESTSWPYLNGATLTLPRDGHITYLNNEPEILIPKKQ